MLNLQRASAGSGKTYSLTRTYLKLLLGIRRGNGGYRLREPAETADAHSRLLAITFTNKATAEMRNRFVAKLAALANAGGADDDVDYMDDFVNEFRASRDQIQRIAALTLSSILNHYSDFQVQTIDSFFQQILHSFTYEAELPDNYAVELDTNMVISAALDSLFLEARANPHGEVHYWLEIYMHTRQRRGLKWNLSNSNSRAFTDLFGYLKMIDNENFKQQRQALTDYFQRHTDMRGLYHEVNRVGDQYVAEVYGDALRAAEALETELESRGVREYMQASLIKRLDNLRAASPYKYPFNSKFASLSKVLLKKGMEKIAPGEYQIIAEAEQKMVREILRWEASQRYVRMVVEAVPVIALIRHLLEKIEQYRTDNNIVQLSDTNTILHTITKDTDVPFIYEKIGTEIDSYMIDEFQDTSAMQWVNMRPLLEQSLSEGHENLIIGDAKQSIYRFRNADSTLITTQVPEEFKNHDMSVLGSTPDENANWRSLSEVVRFNNTVFTWLADKLNTENPASGILNTYESVVQEPRQTDFRGFVCVAEAEAEDADTGEEDTQALNSVKGEMYYLGDTITELIKRGYRQKDIAILVRFNDEARNAVNSLVAYNTVHSGEPGFTPIEFVSDEALLVNRAHSVEIAVAMLRAVKSEHMGFDVAEPADRERKCDEAARKSSNNNTPEPRPYSTYAEDLEEGLNRLRADFPRLSMEELLGKYLKGEKPSSHARELLRNTKSAALPALVENIIALYVPKDLRQKEVSYICAFQDAVVNFCSGHSNDVASFLHWWDAHKDRLCITSPEDADAVAILTIHKAKGLEWRCVLVPECGFSLKVSQREQAWLKDEVPFKGVVPPLLPLSLGSEKNFLRTPYESQYLEVLANTRLDAINLAYVAFTRAADELYLFLSGGGGESVASWLRRFGDKPDEIAAVGSDASLLHADVSEMHFRVIEENKSNSAFCKGEIITYGQRPDREAVLKRTRKLEEKEKEKRVTETKVVTLPDYDVNAGEGMPEYKIVDNLPPVDMEGNIDQRRLGAIKHAILEGIRAGEDVRDEILRMTRQFVVRGKLDSADAEAVYDELTNAVALPEVQPWFAPEMKVLVERTIFVAGEDGEEFERRPDRVVIDPQQNVVVIDYKFGQEHKASHCRQVAEYVSLLRNMGRFGSVRGVVWYVRFGKVVRVD